MEEPPARARDELGRFLRIALPTMCVELLRNALSTELAVFVGQRFGSTALAGASIGSMRTRRTGLFAFRSGRHGSPSGTALQYWWAICAAGRSSSAFYQRSTRWPRRHAPATVLSCRDRKLRTTWDGGRGCRLPTGDGSRAVHGGRTARAAWDCVLPRRVPPHLGPLVEHHTAARARGAATRCRRIRCEVGITP